ncbi:Putative transport protein YdiK [Usitatibacter rugosus]|uniref:Transport protein YdiK n=1 Tax=Usitatibacter rugosus TaxID=2732067 RepID=A0A6M4GV01_9PROT|nr:AI-2E family transporter [Usitatibacter rugosus]QJR10163.1 Putative transport protein YdiK [Usitatibacter rugosus]
MDAVTTDKAPEPRPSTRLMDTLIRAGLLVALAMLCYRIFAPFLTLMVWAVILAITMYPIHQVLAARLRGRQGLSSTLMVLLAFVVLIVPTAVLMSSLGDSVHQLISKVQDHSIEVPRPPDFIAGWPFVGEKIHGTWTRAHDDPKAFVESLQPKIGELAKTVLGFVGGIATGLLQFLGALIVAGIIMAYGQSGGTSSERIFERVVGGGRGAEFTRLCTATIRAVAQGVIGVAFIQAIIVGLCLLVAGVPWAGVLALVVLVLGIAQVPALIVTLPAIGWIWWRGDYGTLEASLYTALIFVSGMADNVLKPLMLGRGVDAPMPVILIGALGGMAAAGILGMFVGAVLLALGYQIFMGWVAANRDGA